MTFLVSVIASLLGLWVVSRFIDRRRTKRGYGRDNVGATEGAHIAEEHARLFKPPDWPAGGVR